MTESTAKQVTSIEGMIFQSKDGTRTMTLDDWLRRKPSDEQLEFVFDFAMDSMVRAGFTEAQQFAGVQTIYRFIDEAIERLKAEDRAAETKH